MQIISSIFKICHYHPFYDDILLTLWKGLVLELNQAAFFLLVAPIPRDKERGGTCYMCTSTRVLNVMSVLRTDRDTISRPVDRIL